jgi:hypothetical protein
MSGEPKPDESSLDPSIEAAKKIVDSALPYPMPELSQEALTVLLSGLSYSLAMRKLDDFMDQLGSFVEQYAEDEAHDPVILQDLEDIIEGPHYSADVVSPAFFLEGEVESEILTLNNVSYEDGTVGAWLYTHPKEEKDVYLNIRMILLVPEMPALVMTRSGLDRAGHEGIDMNTAEAINYFHTIADAVPDVRRMTAGQLSALYPALENVTLDIDAMKAH